MKAISVIEKIVIRTIILLAFLAGMCSFMLGIMCTLAMYLWMGVGYPGAILEWVFIHPWVLYFAPFATLGYFYPPLRKALETT